MSALTQPALLTPGSAKAIWRGCTTLAGLFLRIALVTIGFLFLAVVFAAGITDAMGDLIG